MVEWYVTPLEIADKKARFRAYGQIPPPKPYTTLPGPEVPPIDLCSALESATIIACSDANFSPPQNLILPGRGFDMSDGWETRRSQNERGKYAKDGPLYGVERSEWAIIKFGAGGRGVVRFVEVDTAFHPGNYPVVRLLRISNANERPARLRLLLSRVTLRTRTQSGLLLSRRNRWDRIGSITLISNDLFRLIRSSLTLDTLSIQVSHLSLLALTVDGGSKRVRVFGYPYAPSSTVTVAPTTLTIPALPLTYEAFKPYGQVIQGYSFPSSAPKGTDVSIANQGTAAKFHRLAHVKQTYPEGMLKRGGLHISTIRAFGPQHETKDGITIDITVLER